MESLTESGSEKQSPSAVTMLQSSSQRHVECHGNIECQKNLKCINSLLT